MSGFFYFAAYRRVRRAVVVVVLFLVFVAIAPNLLLGFEQPLGVRLGRLAFRLRFGRGGGGLGRRSGRFAFDGRRRGGGGGGGDLEPRPSTPGLDLLANFLLAG